MKHLSDEIYDGNVSIGGTLTAPIITNHEERITALESGSGGSGSGCGSGYDPRVGDIASCVDIEGVVHGNVTAHLFALNNYLRNFFNSYNAEWFKYSASSDLYFSAPATSGSLGQQVTMSVIVRSTDKSYDSLLAFSQNVKLACNAVSRFSVTGVTMKNYTSTHEDYCQIDVKITGVQANDKFYLYDGRNMLVRSQILAPTIVGGPSSSPSVYIVTDISGGVATTITQITDYSPQGLEIIWKINNAVTTDGITTLTEQMLPNGKYTCVSKLTRTKVQFSSYTSIACQVKHQGKTVENKITPSDWI